jgi:hypothetical protein
VIGLKEAPDGMLLAEGFSDIFTTNNFEIGASHKSIVMCLRA